MDDRAEYLIVKRDLYYRPQSCGYTGIKDHAGRYTLAEAQSRASDEVSFVHESEAPDYTKACYPDLKADHITEKLRAATARIEELEAELAKTREWNRQMVEKAASGGVLDGYRELGMKLLAAEGQAADNLERAERAEAMLKEAVEALQSMDDTIVARSELFISDQECLYNLRDRIRRARRAAQEGKE